MGWNHRKMRIAGMAMILAVANLIFRVSASASYGTEARYIVKYKGNAPRLMGDDGLPFDVVTESEMERLRDGGLLEWFELDGTATLMDSPYYESDQWNLDMIQADGAFGGGHLGAGIRVGVLDSGISPTDHFGVRLLPGQNYIEGAEDKSDTSDTLGHGTSVAGLIAGAGENGYIGAAPAAELIPLKVTDGRDVKNSAICRAIYGGINDYGCNVLNLSLGVAGEYESLMEAVDYAAEKGVSVVAAAGNNGSSKVYYPAGYATVIGVGAVTRNGSVYSRSNHNDSVHITAPGARVRITTVSGETALGDGTSYAVPQVAGAAAVLLGLDPTLTPMQIMGLMAKTATDEGAEGYDEYYGYGIFNLGECVTELTGAQPIPEDPPSEPKKPQKVSFSTCVRDSTCVIAAYSDLNPDSWYHDGVHWALENSVMSGCGGGKFAPNDATTRGQIVQMLWSMEGKPVVGDAITFKDVPAKTWYTEAVRWAAAEKVVAGYSAETFGPDDPLTREQFATILYRYALYKGLDGGAYDGLIQFVDAGEVGQWARKSLSWAAGVGIISGTGNGTLNPKMPATRTQVATMLMRYAVNCVQ